MKRRFIFSLGILMLLGTVLTPKVEAGLVLRLTSYSLANVVLGSVTINDQNAPVGTGLDANANVGAVTYIGGVGNWTINVSTGISQGAGGSFTSSSTFAKMDLNSVNVSDGAGRLVIELADDNFPAFPQNGELIGRIGGTSGGTVDAFGYKHTNSDQFNPTPSIAEVGFSFGSGAFSGTASDQHGALGIYKMLQVVEIKHTGSSSTSFDFELINIVPVPAGVVMFAIGGMLMGSAELLRRRRNRLSIA